MDIGYWIGRILNMNGRILDRNIGYRIGRILDMNGRILDRNIGYRIGRILDRKKRVYDLNICQYFYKTMGKLFFINIFLTKKNMNLL